MKKSQFEGEREAVLHKERRELGVKSEKGCAVKRLSTVVAAQGL